MLLMFFFNFYCRRSAHYDYFFKKQCPPCLLPMMIWQEMYTWSAVGFGPDLEQSEPGLLSHASATKPGWN